MRKKNQLIIPFSCEFIHTVMSDALSLLLINPKEILFINLIVARL